MIELISKPVRTGKTPSDREFRNGDKSILFIKTDTLRIDQIQFEQCDVIPARSLTSNDFLKPGEVLVTIIGATLDIIGRAAALPPDSPRSVTNQNVAVIRLTKDVNPDFLQTFLNTPYGRNQLWRHSRQTGQVNLNCREVERIFIPVFPEPQQEIIADFVKKARSLEERSKNLYKEAEEGLLAALGLDKLDLSPQLSYTATSDEVKTAERLDPEYFQPQYTKIVEYLSRNFPVEQVEQWNKVLKGRSITYLEEGNGVPIVRSGDLIDLHSTEDFKIAAPEQAIFYLQHGDVCISSIGFGSIGKVQVFDKPGKYGTVSEVTVIRQKRINPYYLQIYLQSIAGQLQIEKRITGATGQLHLYPRDVGKIIVPVLPDELQKQFEELVIASRRAKDEAKQLLETAKQRVEQMILGE